MMYVDDLLSLRISVSLCYSVDRYPLSVNKPQEIHVDRSRSEMYLPIPWDNPYLTIRILLIDQFCHQ